MRIEQQELDRFITSYYENLNKKGEPIRVNRYVENVYFIKDSTLNLIEHLKSVSTIYSSDITKPTVNGEVIVELDATGWYCIFNKVLMKDEVFIDTLIKYKMSL